MNAPLPPIYRDCRRLLLRTEEVVRRFSRYHKYTGEADLRQQAFTVMRRVHMAVYDRPQVARHVQALVWDVDAYKLTLQLAIDVGAFVHGLGGPGKPTSPGFAAFETAALLAAQIGKQCGGWQKSLRGLAGPAGDASAGSPAGGSAGALRAQVGTGAQGAGAAGPQPSAA
ncbi:MAG: four helix bundle protein, partial [Rubrivivax sp.]|nr:four helix bundle protein [Rubrivivax sp.]